jgi:hypothetical protein
VKPYHYKQSIASFRGRNNRTKTKILTFLNDRATRGNKKYFTAVELVLYCGVNRNYLRCRIGKWYDWRYLKRRPVQKDNTLMYEYAIAERGKHFLADIAPLEVIKLCAAEINEWLSHIPVRLPN